MDYRSLLDNLEVTAFIRDRRIAGALAATFDRDKASCQRLDSASWHPSAVRRMTGDALRLLAPLM